MTSQNPVNEHTGEEEEDDDNLGNLPRCVELISCNFSLIYTRARQSLYSTAACFDMCLSNIQNRKTRAKMTSQNPANERTGEEEEEADDHHGNSPRQPELISGISFVYTRARQTSYLVGANMWTYLFEAFETVTLERK